MNAEYLLDLGSTPDVRQFGRFRFIADGSITRHRVIQLEGKSWFRFMDYIYAPKPIHMLKPDEVKEICELRLILAERVIDSNFHARMVQEVIERAAQFCSEPSIILDFGVGDGRALPLYRSSYHRSQICGCDMSWQSLRVAPDDFSSVQVSSRGPLPFKTRSFDLILAFFVFHFPLPASMIDELARISRGYLIGTVYGEQRRCLKSIMGASGFQIIACNRSKIASGHSIFVAVPCTNMS